MAAAADVPRPRYFARFEPPHVDATIAALCRLLTRYRAIARGEADGDSRVARRLVGSVRAWVEELTGRRA